MWNFLAGIATTLVGEKVAQNAKVRQVARGLCTDMLRGVAHGAKAVQDFVEEVERDLAEPSEPSRPSA